MIAFVLKNWKAIALAALIAGAFFAGWQVNGWRWEAKAFQAEQVAESARIQLAQDNADLIEEESNREAKIITKTKVVYKQIAAISSDAVCIDDVGLRFRANWNQIARPPSQPDDSTATP